MLKKVTPVLFVEAIEPVLPFWDALGFTRAVEVPEGHRLGFVILVRDGLEVMYQTRESVEHDEPRVLRGPLPPGATMLYIEVEDVDEIAGRFPADTDVIVARRTTPYGAIETIVRDPAGHVLAFAKMGE
ncbi:MAG TPA: VOC family protein [Thermoanaerobaculia bacterium]